MQSAPQFFADDVSRNSGHSGMHHVMTNSNSKVMDPGASGSPIPGTNLRESVTVEQRMLRKKDSAIERLVDETSALSAQLDESNREKAMQRTELTRLRSIIANVIQTAPPLTGTKSLRRVKAHDRVLLTVGMNNATRITSSNTNADFTGYPSQDDLSHMSATGSSVNNGNKKGGKGGGKSKPTIDDDDVSSTGLNRPAVKVPVGAGYDMRKKR